MIRIEVNVKDLGASLGIASVIRACQDKPAMHAAIAQGAESYVREWLISLNDDRSPNTGYYGAASRSVESLFDDHAATVAIPQRGMALHYYGGHVEAGKSISEFTGEPTKALALPTENVPVIGETRARPSDVGILAFLPNTKGTPGTVGYLVEGEEVTNKQGKNKGKTRAKALKDGRLMFVLRSWTDHEADESVLPGIQDLIECSLAAAAKHIEARRNAGLNQSIS